MGVRRRRAAIAGLGLALASDTASADSVAVRQAIIAFREEHGDRPIASIAVIGLRRTRPAVVWQWLRCRTGSPLGSCDLPRIQEQLYRLAIFRSVDIDLRDTPAGVAIEVRLDEKWTLYPVPMLWYSPDTRIAGLVVAEANLFGYNKGVALGGVYSNRGWYTIAGYNDPNIGFTDVWGSLHAFLGSGLLENDRPGGTILQSVDLTRFDLEYSLGTTIADRVSPAWTGAFRTATVGEVHVAGTEPARTATVAVQGLALVYSDRRYRDLYDEGLRLKGEVQHAFGLGPAGSAYSDVIFDAKWTHAAPPHGYLDVRSHGFWGALPVVFEERLGGLDGSRTLPGSGLVAADRYGSLSIDWGIPFLWVPQGTAAAIVFGEVGRYARNDERATNYGGPGLGFRFFLRDVAVPAVGVDAGYEAGSQHVRFTVSVGYRPVR